MTGSVYVWGGLAEFLLSYLDDCALDLPELRRTLAKYDASQRMSITTWWDSLEQIAKVQPLPALGLRIGDHVKVHNFGVLGYLAASCETLGQALQRCQRFQPLLHNLTPAISSRQAKSMHFSWSPAYGRSTRLSNEVVVGSLLRLARILTGHDTLTPAMVEFPEETPPNLAAYKKLLGCPVRFKARTVAVHLPLKTLAMPINSGDPHLRTLLDQQAQALLQVLPQPDTFLSALQKLIVNALQEGESSAEQIAGKMQLPERTLYRRLQERNLSYKGLLNEVRFQLAQQYLADPRLSLSGTALMLGYSEQSSFTRAFKSWCGQTPLHYRKALTDGYKN